MKNKSVQNCRFVHHTKFHCIMTTLKRLFKFEFGRGETGKEPSFHTNYFNFLVENVSRRMIKFFTLLAFSDTIYIGKSLKPIFDSFIDGSSDDLLLVYVIFLRNFCRKSTLKTGILKSRNLNLRLILLQCKFLRSADSCSCESCEVWLFFLFSKLKFHVFIIRS